MVQKKPSMGSAKKIEEESKLDQITKEIVSNKGGNNTMKKEDMEVEKALNTKNEGFKDRKIKELTQKNKALNVAFEREKSLRMKCEKELGAILKETESNLEKLEGKAPAKKKEEGSLEDWKSKYAAADKKIQELRFEKQNLKNELNKTMRVIAREIGENFNIDEVDKNICPFWFLIEFAFRCCCRRIAGREELNRSRFCRLKSSALLIFLIGDLGL